MRKGNNICNQYGRIDMVGVKRNRLTVIGYAYTKNKRAYWHCKCDCGNDCIVMGQQIRRNIVKSCGCMLRDNGKIVGSLPKYKKSANMATSYTRLYKVWLGMKHRCYNSNFKYYPRYGGRGIIMCDEWLDFDKFREWAMANGYEPDAPKGECTLDRIDNDGIYEPNNCRWVDMTVQHNNTSANHLVEYNGEVHNVSEWARITGISRSVLFARLRNGIVGDKLFAPVGTLVKSMTEDEVRESRRLAQRRYVERVGKDIINERNRERKLKKQKAEP